MTESKQPSLMQYFGSDDNEKMRGEVATEISETAKQMESLKLERDEVINEKKEPAVCRIFAETPVEPKDPTAAFFDLLGNDNLKTVASGVIAPLGLTSKADVSSKKLPLVRIKNRLLRYNFNFPFNQWITE